MENRGQLTWSLNGGARPFTSRFIVPFLWPSVFHRTLPPAHRPPNSVPFSVVEWKCVNLFPAAAVQSPLSWVIRHPTISNKAIGVISGAKTKGQ